MGLLLDVGSAPSLGVFKAVALSSQFEDVAAVGEAFGAEDLGPILELEVVATTRLWRS